MSTLFTELKRRNVFRVAIAYVVISWLLIQVIGLAADSFEAPVWVMKMIITILVIGFIPTLLFSWAFELTPEGIKKDADVERDESITSETGNKLNIITIVAVLAVVALLVVDRLLPREVSKTTVLTPKTLTPKTQSSNIDRSEISSRNSQNVKSEVSDNSIAVLPFSDLSQAGDQEYFSDGMAEEILNVLVRVDELKVASRTSAFQFKGRDIGIPEIAKQLKVRHVLEGSVRKSGKTIRITAQLIDAQNDKHLWSNTYDRPLTADNIFAIQDEISNEIVKALSAKLAINSKPLIIHKKTTNNLSAYELYLKARPLYQLRSQLDEADALLVQALELDPDFAQAWALRGAIIVLMHQYGYNQIPIDEAENLGLKYVNKALLLDENTALAYGVRALVHFQSNQTLRNITDYADIVSDLKTAVLISPHNASILNWMGHVYQQTGFTEKAVETFKQCMEFEPRNMPCMGNYIYLQEDLAHDELAYKTFLKGVARGVVTNNNAPLKVLARMDLKQLFLLAINGEALLYGWNRHEEIYQAFKNPEDDHSSLVSELLKFLPPIREQRYFITSELLVSLGYVDIVVNTRFGQSKKLLKSVQFKKHTRASGVYKYWQDHGYPPRCRALPDSQLADDFECD